MQNGIKERERERERETHVVMADGDQGVTGGEKSMKQRGILFLGLERSRREREREREDVFVLVFQFLVFSFLIGGVVNQGQLG